MISYNSLVNDVLDAAMQFLVFMMKL